MPDTDLQRHFDAVVADADSRGGRPSSRDVIRRARRRRAGTVAAAVVAVVAVVGVTVPLLTRTDEPPVADPPGPATLAAALEPATAGWLDGWAEVDTAVARSGLPLPSQPETLIGCFNDGEPENRATPGG